MTLPSTLCGRRDPEININFNTLKRQTPRKAGNYENGGRDHPVELQLDGLARSMKDSEVLRAKSEVVEMIQLSNRRGSYARVPSNVNGAYLFAKRQTRS